MPEFTAGRPRRVLDLPVDVGTVASVRNYDVAMGGLGIVVVRGTEKRPPTTIHVVLNFFEELSGRCGAAMTEVLDRLRAALKLGDQGYLCPERPPDGRPGRRILRMRLPRCTWPCNVATLSAEGSDLTRGPLIVWTTAVHFQERGRNGLKLPVYPQTGPSANQLRIFRSITRSTVTNGQRGDHGRSSPPNVPRTTVNVPIAP